MERNFEMWNHGKINMYMLVYDTYDNNGRLLAEFVKVFYNSTTALNYAKDEIKNKVIGDKSKGYIYQIPHVFASEYDSEVKIYDNSEKIVSELKPLYEIRVNGPNTFII